MQFDLEGAIADLELSIELARSVGSPEEARARHNLGSRTWFRGELGDCHGPLRGGRPRRERFGWLQFALASRSVLCGTSTRTGKWAEALALADELIAGARRSSGASYFEYHPRDARARIALARGDDELALEDVQARGRGRPVGGRPQVLVPVLSQLAFVTAELGLLDEATDAAQELAVAGRATCRPSTSIEPSTSPGSRSAWTAWSRFAGSR